MNRSEPRPGSNDDGATSDSLADDEIEFVVRFGSMRALGVMSASQAYRYGEDVVVQTERGTEVGTVLCEATPAAIHAMPETTQGRILRLQTDNDRAEWARMSRTAGAALDKCQRHVTRLRLEMELVDVELILGGEKLVVYFIAPQRVDFRQLVRDLAKEFHSRIEMRQIGVRDEAKLLADYGDCGRPICCANHLSKMPPVSMKMAKLQKSTLDPSKISGRCGRLKCCLRYEFETYDELSSKLPEVGSRVVTREGNMVVLSHDILSQQLLVSTEDRRRILIDANDVLTVVK
ncbi:MAG: regulatory iron-sulfur-containing complex subunit RicT [Planctomycetota bacterium]